MSASPIQNLRQWVRHDPHPLARKIFFTAKAIRNWDFPAPKYIYGPLYFTFQSVSNIYQNILRVFLWTPMFKSQLASAGKGLYLYDGGPPCTVGPLKFVIGDNCRINSKVTVSGRAHGKTTPEFILGNNIDLGWMTTIAVGNRIEFGDNVRLAGQCFLAGYPGHPLNPTDRANGLPETDDQAGDIILENDVWLGTGVSVMAGVTIGHGTVVGAGSVVTKDLPPMVLAAGNPARVIRSLDENHELIKGAA